MPVCEDCLAGIQPFEVARCRQCGERVLSPYFSEQALEEQLCGLCRRVPPPFAKAAAFGSYDGSLRSLLHLFKYQGVHSAANLLAGLLAVAIVDQIEAEQLKGEQLELDLPRRVLVIPVPLHRSKRRQRGFNQAEALAKHAVRRLRARSRTMTFEYAPGLLERVRATVSQTGLTRHQRRENVRGAFRVLHPEEVRGREVLLVDDVFTTGTTLSECARVLLRHRAKKVWLATVARVLKADATPLFAASNEYSTSEGHSMKEVKAPVGAFAAASGA